jgi:co-chaperonin GroES (HSP10)
MNEFNLLGNRILIQFQEEGPKTLNGIIMPSNIPERFPKAIVCHVSLDVPLVNEGDMIIIDRHSGIKIMINEEQYQLIKSEDVIAAFQVK